MAQPILTAEVAQVPFGHFEVQGLVDSEGCFYVAIVQANEILRFSDDQSQASKPLKRLLGEGFQTTKLKTPLNPKAVNALSLKNFEKVVVELAIKGNSAAAQMVRDLVGLSLHQLFCDAFGIKFEQEDRQEWLRTRQESKSLFWQLTEQIKIWLDGRQCSAPEYLYYSNAFDALNLGLFGMRSKAIREELALGSGSLNRDHFGREALRHVIQVQETAARKMQRDRDLAPIEAVKQAIDANALSVASYKA